MSQTLAAATQRRPSPAAAPRPSSRPPRPTLRVVRAPMVERGRAVFAVTCLLLLVSGLLSLLLINTALAQGSFALHDLQTRSDELADRQQSLRQSIDVEAAPARLAARAQALGMVPSQSPAFLRLSDGRLLGVATPAKPAPAPTVSGGTVAHSGQSGQTAHGTKARNGQAAQKGVKPKKKPATTPTKTR